MSPQRINSCRNAATRSPIPSRSNYTPFPYFMKLTSRLLVLAGLLLASGCAHVQSAAEPEGGSDKNFWIFLCFGQSNMEGFPRTIQDQDKTVDPRFQMLAAVDFPNMGRTNGNWYPAVPPLCRPGCGLCPADYFGRTLVANLPQNIRVGVINVSVAGCKIEMFQKTNYESYVSTQASWLKNIAGQYGGNPYARLVELAKQAQKDGVIKGILLHQGESNTGDRSWPQKVKGIYDDLLKDLDLKAGNVPLLAGEVVAADQRGQCASMNAIIDQLPQTIPTSYAISAAGCTAVVPPLHFNSAGYRELGKRYGEKMLGLMGYKVAESK
jgi:alpha-L-fucosidase 2